MGLILIVIVLVILFGGGFYSVDGNYPYRGPGIGIGGVLLLILLIWLLTGHRL